MTYGTDYDPSAPRSFTFFDVAGVVLFLVVMLAICFLPPL